MTPGGACLISIVTGLPPPKNCRPETALPPEIHHDQQQQVLLNIKTHRRNVAFLSLLSLLPSLAQPAPASAFSIGISGPKDWLREQKKKASKYVLAPIDASRNSLRTAQLLLTSDSDSPNKDFGEVQNLLRSATRDCVPQERNSFVSFQSRTGVEVCTFRLILKNASSLLDDKDPVKMEAEAILVDLIRSFSSLNDVANDADLQLAPSREKVAGALMDTISALDRFEQGIKDCLEV
ncbi:hypothetical protein BVC80_1117g14 [Macleaya cordata]|uniref:Uncharacterized protein n=1 Tax=Macleaya cordata TaxID=56857 RepID=A0A200Q997_MACCD|nr:hypothetical protein BVC80_1117g14 [Macleaya cordata]